MTLKKPEISIIGVGYVGLCTAVGFASKGYTVIASDGDPEKAAKIKGGIPPFHEPSLPEMLKENIQNGNLQCLVNQTQKTVQLCKEQLGNLKNKNIAILGLAFKPDTDDMREARAIPIINQLLTEGAHVTAYDPVAMPVAKTIFKNKIQYATSAINCLKNADCCIIVTEWNEFKKLTPEDFTKNMKHPILIDGRGIYSPETFSKKLKFAAIGLGKKLNINKKEPTKQRNLQLPTKTFYVCADGAYIKDGKILLLKRNTEPFKGFWHLVGGHVEENETLKEALKREFKEETNLDVEVGKIIDGRIENTPDRVKIIAVFEVISAKGKIKLNSENQEYGWFTSTPPNSVYDYTKYLKQNVNSNKSALQK